VVQNIKIVKVGLSVKEMNEGRIPLEVAVEAAQLESTVVQDPRGGCINGAIDEDVEEVKVHGAFESGGNRLPVLLGYRWC